MSASTSPAQVSFSVNLSPKALRSVARIGETLGIEPGLIIAGGPPILAFAFRVIRDEAGVLTAALSGAKVTSAMKEGIPIPTVEEFRSSPSARALEATPGELGGIQADGGTTRILALKSEIDAIRSFIHARSDAETFGYSVWCLMMLLNSQCDIAAKGGILGVYSQKAGKFYGFSELLTVQRAQLLTAPTIDPTSIG